MILGSNIIILQSHKKVSKTLCTSYKIKDLKLHIFSPRDKAWTRVSLR